MVIIDPSSAWADQFPEDYLPLIINLILDSWKSFQIPEKRLEVPITQKLCAHLRNHKDRSKHFFRIEWEPYELDREGNVSGRIDLKFIHGASCNEQVYFAFECKLLRVPDSKGNTRALAAEYVKEGMVRYFNGQYAVGLNKGGMLGYVMDGDITKAKKNIKKAIEQRRDKLHMAKAGTTERTDIVRDRRVFKTEHLPNPPESFTIHHILLAVQ